MVWGNAKSLEMWNAATMEELWARDFSDMSETASNTLGGYLKEFEREYEETGEIASRYTEIWTFYPKGNPDSSYLPIPLHMLPTPPVLHGLFSRGLNAHSPLFSLVLSNAHPLILFKTRVCTVPFDTSFLPFLHSSPLGAVKDILKIQFQEYIMGFQ